MPENSRKFCYATAKHYNRFKKGVTTSRIDHSATSRLTGNIARETQLPSLQASPRAYRTPPNLQVAAQPMDASLSGSSCLDSPTTSTATPRQQTARPTVGGKCPRRNLVLQPSETSDDEGHEICNTCVRLKRRIRE